MGWNDTGKFGIHSGKTLRRYPTRKNGDSKTQSRNEFAVVKELRCGKKVKNVDTAKLGLAFEDGGLPLEKHSLVYSLNKHKRWLLPELLKENVSEMFHEENDNEKTDLCQKKKTKKPKKGGKEKADSKLHVSVVERHCSTSGKSWRYRPDCVGVTSNVPLDPSEPERKPKKKYAHVGDLKSKVDDEDTEIYYEFLAPYPQKVWLNKREFSCYQRNVYPEWQDDVEESNLKKKGKRKQIKCCKGNLHEIFDEFETMDDHYNDVSEEYDLEPFNSEFLYPIGASIQEAIEAKTVNSEVILEPNESVPASPASAVYGKGQAVYIDNDSEIPKDTTLPDGQAVSKFETLSKDKTFKMNLSTEDIACDSLSNKFGMNYIEDEISPRKFIIKLDLNELISNDHGEICVLFELPINNSTGKNTVEANVSLSLPKTELAQSELNGRLQSELNGLQNDETLTVKAITDCLMEKIVSQLSSESKSIVTKKCRTAMNMPIEFIKQLSKQEPVVCGLKKATEFALGCQNRTDEPCLVTLENGNIDENEKLFCEICYVEDDVETSLEKSGFTQLLKCSHHFCNGCLSLYIVSKIDAGQSSITCPYFNCKTTIDEPLVWSCTNSTFYQKYRKLHVQNLISTNPQLQYCPTADCSHLAYIDGLEIKQPNSVPVLCKCGLVWCFSCQKPAHWPASCKEMDTFLNQFKDHEEYMKMLRFSGSISSVKVKRCPTCHEPIEKSYGCSHMMCHNNHEFCWECLVPWDEHDDWYFCGERSKEPEEVELAITNGSARYDKYCKMAVRNGLERCGKKFAAFKQSTEKAKQVENAHKLVTHNPKTSTCKFVQNYIEKNIASVVDDLFCFKNLAHFVLENTAVYVAITRATKLVKPLDRNIEILNFVVQRCSEVLLEPSVLLKEGRLETIQELLKQGQELIWNIDRLIKANRKE